MNSARFRAVDLKSGNARWRSLFNDFWPAYRSWYQSGKPAGISTGELRKAQRALNSAMPELMPVYQALCDGVNDDPVAMQFLTLYQPPAYLINCSQAVFFDQQPILIRNYDLSPELSENTIVRSAWQGREVMATSECLWGADDGINDAGLAVSLTFGGRREVADGFGIPLIIRYVLQTCETVAQTIAQLSRVPSHMAYNVTVVDASGDTATVMLIPGRDAIVTRQGVATNHQQAVVWPEQAVFSRTRERKRHLEALLKRDDLNEASLVEAFHRAPLYATNYPQNFGTVYTAVYRTRDRSLTYHWPGERWHHNLSAFAESEKVIALGAAGEGVSSSPAEASRPAQPDDSYDDSLIGGNWNPGTVPSPAMAQLEAVISRLPEACVSNRAAHRSLVKRVRTGSPMSWVQFADAMRALWV